MALRRVLSSCLGTSINLDGFARRISWLASCRERHCIGVGVDDRGSFLGLRRQTWKRGSYQGRHQGKQDKNQLLAPDPLWLGTFAIPR
jgi:hypothetical protein